MPPKEFPLNQPPPAQSHSSRIEPSEMMLSELLESAPDLAAIAEWGLHFILEHSHFPGGMLVIQSSADPGPVLLRAENPGTGWYSALGDLNGPLPALLGQSLQTGEMCQASPGEALVGLPDLAACIPASSRSGSQAILLLRCDSEKLTAARLAEIRSWLRLVGWAVAACRSADLGLPGMLQAAQTRLETSQGELRRSQTTLRTVFDSLPAVLYIVDSQYKLVAVNAAGAQRASLVPEALPGQFCYQALYNFSVPCPGCRVQETLLSGHFTMRTERRGMRSDDLSEWEISAYPILDEAGQVIQALLLEQDVTEKRRMEGILAQSEKMAAVGQLAAGVAHEINNPLTAIIANAQILQRELPPHKDLQESVELIARAGERATQVVRNLLDFARKDQYLFNPTDINETIRRSLALVQHELITRSISLSFEPDPDLPFVQASGDHLLGVWLNLLLNAMDAMEGRPGYVRVITAWNETEVRVAVIDEGKGIAPERLSRIFEPFYTTKAPGRGTGLGLSVCQRIVSQHGGKIEVQSRLGEGSQFTVILPVHGAER